VIQLRENGRCYQPPRTVVVERTPALADCGIVEISDLNLWRSPTLTCGVSSPG
jgi:hypothetical protein